MILKVLKILKLSNQFTQIVNYNKFFIVWRIKFSIKNLWNNLNLTRTFDKVVPGFSHIISNILIQIIDDSNEFFIKNNIHKISSTLLIPYGKHSVSFGIDKFKSSKLFLFI